MNPLWLWVLDMALLAASFFLVRSARKIRLWNRSRENGDYDRFGAELVRETCAFGLFAIAMFLVMYLVL